VQLRAPRAISASFRATRRCSRACAWTGVVPQGHREFYLSVAFGFAEVLPDRVRLLARIAERAEEIDVARPKSTAAGREMLQAARAGKPTSTSSARGSRS